MGLTLRLDETEFGFLHEVKDKLGCTMSSYIRFLIHRSTYEEQKPKSKREQNAIEKISLLLKEKKLTETFRLFISESERNELERVKINTGIPFNTQIRWMLRRRIVEYTKLGGELFEVV